jgi:hypothetical protein
VAGLGVDHRDDPFGGHALGDAHAALSVVFDVLGRDHLQKRYLDGQGGVVICAAGLGHFSRIGEQVVHQCGPFGARSPANLRLARLVIIASGQCARTGSPPGPGQFRPSRPRQRRTAERTRLTVSWVSTQSEMPVESTTRR